MTTLNQNTVSMMQLRSQPGTVLDKVFYRNEIFIVERSGQAKAVIVPIKEYEEMKRIKKEAKTRLFKLVDTIQTRTKKYRRKDIDSAIDEALSQGK